MNNNVKRNKGGRMATGDEIIKVINRKKYDIVIVKQDNLEKDLTEYYKLVAKLLYNLAINQ